MKFFKIIIFISFLWSNPVIANTILFEITNNLTVFDQNTPGDFSNNEHRIIDSERIQILQELLNDPNGHTNESIKDLLENYGLKVFEKDWDIYRLLIKANVMRKAIGRFNLSLLEWAEIIKEFNLQDTDSYAIAINFVYPIYPEMDIRDTLSLIQEMGLDVIHDANYFQKHIPEELMNKITSEKHNVPLDLRFTISGMETLFSNEQALALAKVYNSKLNEDNSLCEDVISECYQLEDNCLSQAYTSGFLQISYKELSPCHRCARAQHLCELHNGTITRRQSFSDEDAFNKTGALYTAFGLNDDSSWISVCSLIWWQC